MLLVDQIGYQYSIGCFGIFFCEEECDLFDQLQGEQVFSKIDFLSRYHQLKIKEKNIHNTTFQTQYRHYEFFVMPFDLTIASCCFHGPYK